MYAETGLMLPYSHDFPQFQKFDDVYFPENLHAPSGVMGSSLLLQTPSSTMSDYYIGEGDLFKAPNPILEEPLMELDPMTSSISMMSFGGGGDVVIGPPQTSLPIPEIESVGELLSDVYFECKKDLLPKVGEEIPLSSEVVAGVVDVQADEIFKTADQKLLVEESNPIQKSVSTSCLKSMDVRPNFIDFALLDFGAVNGMRRSYSEGDIKNLGDGNNNNNNHTSSIQQSPLGISTREDRKEKLSRYRQKRSKRNFGRKIKYACRKALADSQPRIRGRFAKTEDVVVVDGSMKKQ